MPGGGTKTREEDIPSWHRSNAGDTHCHSFRNHGKTMSKSNVGWNKRLNKWKPGRHSIETGKMTGIRTKDCYPFHQRHKDPPGDQEDATKSTREIAGRLINPRELRVKWNRFRDAKSRNIEPVLGDKDPRQDEWRHWGDDRCRCRLDAIPIRRRLWCKQEVEQSFERRWRLHAAQGFVTRVLLHVQCTPGRAFLALPIL